MARPEANPAVYCTGQAVPVADTVFGKTAFLLCGDLFTEDVTTKLRRQHIDVLLYPFARAMSGNDPLSVWNKQELPDYIAEWRKTAQTTLAVNTFSPDGGYMGGAYLVSEDAVTVVASPSGGGMLNA